MKTNGLIAKKGEVRFDKLPYMSKKEMEEWRRGFDIVIKPTKTDFKLFLVMKSFDSDNVMPLDYFVTMLVKYKGQLPPFKNGKIESNAKNNKG